MQDLLIPGLIGLIAGLLGGLLGIGGSTIIIPGLIFYLSYTAAGYSGSEQHLIQASAMVCNVFIAVLAVVAHRRAGAVMKPVVIRLVPAALVGILLGVALSNSRYFAEKNGRFLAMGLAGFLIYVAGYNVWRLFSRFSLTDNFDETKHLPGWKIFAVGLPMGFLAGLLGIGGGALCVPGQQLLLKLPLRRAIANSAATIMFVSLMGAAYKNLTLAEHNVSMMASLRLAGLLIPTAILGSFLGAGLTHTLPPKLLRIVFIIFVLAVAYMTFVKSHPPTTGHAEATVPSKIGEP